MDEGANEGVRLALAAGNVREVSLVVNTPHTGRGVAIAKAKPGTGVGLHLNLTEGDALTGPIPGVTSRAGRFLGLRPLLFLSAVRLVRDVRREIEAQLARLRAFGFLPSHLNGHHHVHLLPGVRECVLDVVRAEAIPHVRMPVERTPRLSATRAICARLAKRFPGPVRTLPFVGHGLYGARDYEAKALSLLALLPSPCEWMAHPRTGSRFEGELLALGDPAFFRSRGIVPATFAEAHAAQPEQHDVGGHP